MLGNKSVMPKMIAVVIAVIMTVGQMVTSIAWAQTGRPISGVIAATDKPIAVSYVNEEGETIGRIAGVGEPIYLNDEITTPAGASLQVLLRDQTVFSIGPNSTLVFDEFIFDPTSPDELALTASVTKGSFKFISGKISKLKPGAMTLKLPNATASVRGTSVVGRVSETGASDIVLLTGAVQLSTASAPAVDLIQPGWGISVGETGAASAPTQFSPEDIDTIIQEVETNDDAAGDETEVANAAGGEEAAEEEPSEEAVESVAEVVREAGTEVSEEDIVSIIKAADGDPGAVAEGIVKAIIETRIESGDIDAEALAEFESFVSAQGEGLGDEGGAFIPEDFKIEDLNVADLKVEDLGIEGFSFGGDDSFVDAFSERLDTDILALPKFDETDFGFGTVQFEDVKFDTAAFDSTQITVTQRFDIKEVSQLIVGNEFGGDEAPEIEFSFFDILFNAEAINQEVAKRETSFSFEEASFGERTDDGKEPQETATPDDGTNFANEEPVQDDAPTEPTILFSQKIDEEGVAKIVIERPVFDDGKTETDGGEAATETEVPSFEAAELFLNKFVEEETEAKTEVSVDELAEASREEASDSQKELADLIERVQLETREGTLDPLAYYKEGNAEAHWLVLQSGNRLGHDEDYGTLISESFSGTVRFRDSFDVKDAMTTFSAKAGYDITLDYDTAAVTGSFALSNMSYNEQTYYSENDVTSHSEEISNVSLAGRDTPSGTLSQGEAIRNVDIATVDFYNNTTDSEVSSRIRTNLDMSVGSTQVVSAALDGTLGEFRVEVEQATCTNASTCGSSEGLVASEISVVKGE